MIAPDLKQLETMPKREVATFWFNYWNDLFPVSELRLEYETEGYIAPFSGYASYSEKKTAFNLDKVESNEWTFYSVARHEHAHQLLKHYGYDNSHLIHFALVDAALERAFELARGKKNPDWSLRFYDIHEDRLSKKRLNIRAFALATKRLVRYVSDIELLLSKALFYAELIEATTPEEHLDFKKRYYDSREKSQLQIDQIFEHWSNSDKQMKSEITALQAEITTLEDAISKKEEAIAQAHDKYSALNKLNARWQGAFLGLLLLGSWLITRTTT